MRASTLPSIPPISRLSTKKHTTPASTRAQAARSSRSGFFRQKRTASRMTKIGAVNCKTMVLAAVVSLLAMEKSTLVPHTLTAPRAIHRFSRNRCPLTAR